MSRVDIDAVDASNFVGRVVLEVKGVKKSTLVEVQSVNLVSRSGDDGVT